jgi:hypothetical protein
LSVLAKLDGLFPGEFLAVTMSGPCLRHLGTQRHLSELSAPDPASSTSASGSGAGAVVYADRPFSCLRLVGGAEAVQASVSAVRRRVAAWSETRKDAAVEDFMVPQLLGTGAGAGAGGGGGLSLHALEERLGVQLDLLQPRGAAPVLEIHSSSLEASVRAKVALEEVLSAMKDSHWSAPASAEVLGQIIGKKGASIKKLREETGAQVNADTSRNTVTVTGTPTAVAAARVKIEALLATDREQVQVCVLFPAGGFPVLVGSKGVTAKEIQDTSGARVDLDKHERGVGTATLRGSR